MECDKCQMSIGPGEVAVIVLIQILAWAALIALVRCLGVV